MSGVDYEEPNCPWSEINLSIMLWRICGPRARLYPLIRIAFANPAKRKLTFVYFLIGSSLLLWYFWNGGLLPHSSHGRGKRSIFPDVELNRFFPQAVEDSYLITWASHQNHMKDLQDSLSSDVMMIEGDVVLRHQGLETQELMPVMSKPPKTDGDMTFDSWMKKVVQVGSKGVKLNFRSIETVEISLQKLKNFDAEIEFPIWLSAEVLIGPNCECHKKTGDLPKPRWDLPVDPSRFLRLVTSMYRRSTLVLGWTTHYHKEEDNAGYTWPMVHDMYNLLLKWNTHRQPIVFSVRGPLLQKSLPQIEWLIDVTGAKLLIWAEEEDEMESSVILLLQIMRQKFPKTMIYYQLTEHISTKFAEHMDDIVGSSLPKDWQDLSYRSFNAEQWMVGGPVADVMQNINLGSHAAVISDTRLSGQKFHLMSKGIYKSTKDYPLHIFGKVTFITDTSVKKEKPSTRGLSIHIRATTESNPSKLDGVSFFIGDNGAYSIFSKNSGPDLKQEGQTSLEKDCARFEIVDDMKTIYLKISSLVDCEDPLSMQVKEKSSLVFDLSNKDVDNKNSRIYVEVVGPDTCLVIDELRVQ